MHTQLTRILFRDGLCRIDTLRLPHIGYGNFTLGQYACWRLSIPTSVTAVGGVTKAANMAALDLSFSPAQLGALLAGYL